MSENHRRQRVTYLGKTKKGAAGKSPKQQQQQQRGMANPFIDSIFKTILDEETTIRFLNSLLKPDSPITKVFFSNTESNDIHADGKRVYFDVACEEADGRKFIVEMQRIWRYWLKNRLIYYTCRKVNEEGKKYEAALERKTDSWNYREMNPVCTICLLNNEDGLLKDSRVKRDIVLYDRENGEPFSDAMRIVIINMSVMEHKNLSEENEYYQNFLVLMRQISENMWNTKEMIRRINALPFSEGEKRIFRRVVSVTDTANMTEAEYRRYEEERKIFLDHMTFYTTERADGKAEGLTEGLAQGLAQGMQQGIKQGLEKGRAEGEAIGMEKAMIEVARKMKEDGQDIPTISKFTGLSESDIKSL